MKGSEMKLVAFMQGADKRFVIPVYQRNYDWKTENCKQLFDDLKRLSRHSARATSLAALFLFTILMARIWNSRSSTVSSA